MAMGLELQIRRSPRAKLAQQKLQWSGEARHGNHRGHASAHYIRSLVCGCRYQLNTTVPALPV